MLPSAGLTSLEELSFTGVNSIWTVPDGVLNLPKLKKVSVPVQRRFLCCAFLYKRQKSVNIENGVASNGTRNCTAPLKPTTQPVKPTTAKPTTAKPTTVGSTASSGNKPTTDNPWGRRKRALLWFKDSWEVSNWTTSDPQKTG